VVDRILQRGAGDFEYRWGGSFLSKAQKSAVEKIILDGREERESTILGQSLESRLSEESSALALEDIRESVEERAADDRSESMVRRESSSRESQRDSRRFWRSMVVRLECSCRFFSFLISWRCSLSIACISRSRSDCWAFVIVETVESGSATTDGGGGGEVDAVARKWEVGDAVDGDVEMGAGDVEELRVTAA
jgi:hypothetical protein